MQSEISCRNPVKCDFLYTAGVWPTYLFVAGSIILLQCLSMINKLGQFIGMMAYEDYSCWSRYLPLGNWMTRKLGRIIEKEIISPKFIPEKCSLKSSFMISLTLGAACFLPDPWTKQSLKEKHYSAWASAKCPLNFMFLVSTNASWFLSPLRTPSGYHRMDKICFNSHC